MIDEYQKLLKEAKSKKKETKKFFQKLKKRVPKNLDQMVHKFHDEVFEEIDCLKCANCCKSTGPLFTRRDIDRISKHLRIRAGEFEEDYLRMDEEGDWVLQQTPCSFLGEDHLCSIYGDRPKACAAYPHTDHVGFGNILNITLKNTQICPAAYLVVEKMKNII